MCGFTFSRICICMSWMNYPWIWQKLTISIIKIRVQNGILIKSDTFLRSAFVRTVISRLKWKKVSTFLSFTCVFYLIYQRGIYFLIINFNVFMRSNNGKSVVINSNTFLYLYEVSQYCTWLLFRLLIFFQRLKIKLFIQWFFLSLQSFFSCFAER